MGITLPGESPQYRAARDLLLEREIDLRRATEAVAAARRELPPGGRVKMDYVFQGANVRSGRLRRLVGSKQFGGLTAPVIGSRPRSVDPTNSPVGI